jgi:hypothetical protein
MFKRHPNLVLAALLLLALAIGALQGRRVERLRESEAFYRWILAAATNERLFQESSEEEEYLDQELFTDVARVVESALPDVAPDTNLQEGIIVTKLGLVVGDRTHDYLVWDLARGPMLSPQRQQFLKYARERKLMFAKGIQYAEAQASGVSVFNLFFGFRKVAANFIWLQVDRYWHQGMMYRMIPLMRTCVALDPNFVDAYLLGSWHLAYNVTAKMSDTPQPLKNWSEKYKVCLGEKETFYYLAIDFLSDGIRNNLREYTLYFDLGFAIYKNKLSDYPNAVRYLTEAVRQPHKPWVRRQLYICQELNGQYAESLAGWQEYAKLFPDNTVAPRFIQRNIAQIHEQRMQKAKDAARIAADPQAAEAKRQEAEEQKQSAIAVWKQMRDEGDPYGDYRILRLEALDLAEQKRYMEAVAVLDKARWESPSNFDEASEFMIKIKQEGNLPLSVSEKKAVLRQEEGDTCPGMPAPVPAEKG